MSSNALGTAGADGQPVSITSGRDKHFHIRTLGAFELRAGDSRISLGTRKAEGLVALVAMRAGRPVTRERLDGLTLREQPFESWLHYFFDHQVLLQPGEKLHTECTFNNTNDFGVPFGESTDNEMCFQFAFHWPAHSLSNGVFSWSGVPDACW